MWVFFHIEYSEFCEKETRGNTLVVQLLSLAEQLLTCTKPKPNSSKMAILFQTKSRVLGGSLEILSSVKGSKYHKWLQVCHHSVLTLPNLTYLM